MVVGPRSIDDRLCLQGILFVLLTGVTWQQLPPELGFGLGQTCWRRICQRTEAGFFDQLHQFKHRDFYDSLVPLACALACWRRLKKPMPGPR
ncbi:transposase [Kitasatospora cineracea]|uniref:transposase n=1 Tax=Kitasatospora cineracea TaxID=88074 RepID=UPI0013C2CFB5